MKAKRNKLELAMAWACMESRDLPIAAGLPRPTVQNLIVGKSVRPATLDRVRKVPFLDVELMAAVTMKGKSGRVLATSAGASA